MALIDVVVAVRNEEESLPIFFDRLMSLALPDGIQLGCIFVEDGSSDLTRQIIRDKAALNRQIKYLFLESGKGQGAAISLGISRSEADAVIMMDVDGGHPLELIPIMINEYVQGAAAVQAVRRQMVERSRYRDIGTFFFNGLYQMLSGVDTRTQNVYYRLVTRPIIEKLLDNNRWKYFLRINYKGFPGAKVSYVYFNAAERLLGVSKYNIRRLIRFAWIAVLSSMSVVRFAIGAFLALILCAALAVAHCYILAIVFGILVLVAILEFTSMSQKDVLSELKVQESRV